jgi:hypothetical protein
MWLYPGPRCPDRPFSDELGEVEVNTRIRNVLDHGADLNPGAGPTPSPPAPPGCPRLVYLHPFWAVCAISSSHHARDLVQGPRYAYNAPWGIKLPENGVKC